MILKWIVSFVYSNKNKTCDSYDCNKYHCKYNSSFLFFSQLQTFFESLNLFKSDPKNNNVYVNIVILRFVTAAILFCIWHKWRYPKSWVFKPLPSVLFCSSHLPYDITFYCPPVLAEGVGHCLGKIVLIIIWWEHKRVWGVKVGGVLTPFFSKNCQMGKTLGEEWGKTK